MCTLFVHVLAKSKDLRQRLPCAITRTRKCQTDMVCRQAFRKLASTIVIWGRYPSGASSDKEEEEEGEARR